MIKPFGHRILVKILEKKTTDSGLLMPDGIEPEFCSWAKIVALPNHKLNKFINGLKVGDEVAYFHFGKDTFIDEDTGEKLMVLEAERDGGIKGQIVAHKSK